MNPQEETTVERIRTAAAELFAERGYGGASMAGIAERVGIQKASLYNYYASKAALLIDLVERSLTCWSGACAFDQWSVEGDGSEAPAAERLFEHLVAVQRFAHRERDRLILIQLAASLVGGELGDRTHALYAEHGQRYADKMTRFFERAMASGEIHPGDPEAVTVAWRSFLDGLLMRQIHCPSAGEPSADWLREVWGVFWRGLGPGPGGERQE